MNVSEHIHECVGCWTDDGVWQVTPGEPIVRCKDCRFFEPEFVYEERHEEIHCSEFMHEPPGCVRFKTSGVVPNGFCAWGEPKEDAGHGER